jgi:hypothetical protein
MVPGPTPSPYRWRWAALAVPLVAEAMNLLDATIVAVAAPVIHGELTGPDSDIQWFSAAYTLPFAVLLITARAVRGAAAALVIPQIEGAGDPAARPSGAAAGSGRRGAVEAKPE